MLIIALGSWEKSVPRGPGGSDGSWEKSVPRGHSGSDGSGNVKCHCCASSTCLLSSAALAIVTQSIPPLKTTSFDDSLMHSSSNCMEPESSEDYVEAVDGGAGPPSCFITPLEGCAMAWYFIRQPIYDGVNRKLYGYM